jgi:hypothetical protein
MAVRLARHWVMSARLPSKRSSRAGCEQALGGLTDAASQALGPGARCQLGGSVGQAVGGVGQGLGEGVVGLSQEVGGVGEGLGQAAGQAVRGLGQAAGGAAGQPG